MALQGQSCIPVWPHTKLPLWPRSSHTSVSQFLQHKFFLTLYLFYSPFPHLQCSSLISLYLIPSHSTGLSSNVTTSEKPSLPTLCNVATLLLPHYSLYLTLLFPLNILKISLFVYLFSMPSPNHRLLKGCNLACVITAVSLAHQSTQHLVGTQKYLLIEWINKYGRIPFFLVLGFM